MKSKFEVNGKSFEIEYSVFGYEKYLYDGKVIRSCWSFKTKQSTEIFDINGDELKIENKASFKSFNSSAFLNGQLIVDDLFPYLTRRIEQNKERNSWRKALVSMVVSCGLTMLIISIYNTYK